MALSIELLSSQIVDAGLLSAQDLTAVFVEHKPADAEQLIKQLVKQKLLTAYQAQQVYAGKAKSLVLGNYILLDKLGQGGMGMVLKAQHRRMKRIVALKVLSPAVAKSPDLVARFHREVEAVAKLNHPNIVAAFDADESHGTLFLVMEFVDGKDLASVVKSQGPLSMAQALKCILQAARGLEYAHHQRIIHRDIKPANLLVDHAGVVRILDMGLARIDSDEDKHELTSTGAVMGTVDYMAPEQALSTKHADARSDIYSLGISLWFLLTGKAAYQGESMMARLLGHRDAPIPSLAEALAQRTSGKPISPQQAAAIDAIFRKMVAKKPEERYQSMQEVVRAIEGLQSGDLAVTNLAGVAAGSSDGISAITMAGPTAANDATRVATQPQTAVTPVDDDHLVPGSPFAATLASGDGESPTDPVTRTAKKAALLSQSGIATKGSPKLVWILSHRKLVIGGGLASLILVAMSIMAITGKGRSPSNVDGAASEVELSNSASVSPPVPAQPANAPSDSEKNETANRAVPDSAPITFDQPPSLDDWLKGRSILKVARDGRGQFQTIQAALDVLKPGQAIEVLDRGPYQESLKVIRPPADTGLFSRVQTVLEIPHWEKYTSQSSKTDYRNGHQFFHALGFRISGFEITGKGESFELPHSALYFEGSGGVTIEDCQLRFLNVTADITPVMAAIRLNGFGTDPLQANVVRNCVMNGGLSTVAWPGMASAPLAIIHNYVQPLTNGHGMQFSGPMRRVFVRENIVKTDSRRAGFVITVGRPGAELIEFSRNTVVGTGDNRFQATLPAGDVVIGKNVGPAFKLVNGAESQRSQTENWHVFGNWYSIRPESMPTPENFVYRRLSDPIAEVKFLSEDPADPNFARLNPGVGGDIAGALPGGPVTTTGDWFSALQNRWSLFRTPAIETPVASPAPPVTSPTIASETATFDLISSLNLALDRVSIANLTGKNDWAVKDSELTYTSDGKSGKVLFPILMNDVRSFTIEGDIRRTMGSGVFSFAIPVSDSLMTSLDLIPGGNIQLGLQGGKRQTIGQWAKSPDEGGRLRIAVEERPDGSGSVLVEVNGKEAARWNGNIRTIGKSLEFHPDHPGQRLLGIFCFKDSFKFRNLKLTIRNGTARSLR